LNIGTKWELRNMVFILFIDSIKHSTKWLIELMIGVDEDRNS